jgi:hypothetical protein
MESLRVQTIVAAAVTAIGIILLAYMISVEGELGAIPLLLLAVGVGWLGLTRRRIRSLRRHP